MIKTIILFLAIYFIGKFVFRYLLPGVLIFNKMKKQMDAASKQRNTKSKKKISHYEEKGEYIEYEEIK